MTGDGFVVCDLFRDGWGRVLVDYVRRIGTVEENVPTYVHVRCAVGDGLDPDAARRTRDVWDGLPGQVHVNVGEWVWVWVNALFVQEECDDE